MEAEIVQFDQRDEDIRLIRWWWRSNPAFSTIDEDEVFENLLKNNFESFVSFIGFIEHMGGNPKTEVVKLIIEKNTEVLSSFVVGSLDEVEDSKTVDHFVSSFLASIKNELAAENVRENDSIRERLKETFKKLFDN